MTWGWCWAMGLQGPLFCTLVGRSARVLVMASAVIGCRPPAPTGARSSKSTGLVAKIQTHFVQCPSDHQAVAIWYGLNGEKGVQVWRSESGLVLELLGEPWSSTLPLERCSVPTPPLEVNAGLAKYSLESDPRVLWDLNGVVDRSVCVRATVVGSHPIRIDRNVDPVAQYFEALVECAERVGEALPIRVSLYSAGLCRDTNALETWLGADLWPDRGEPLLLESGSEAHRRIRAAAFAEGAPRCFPGTSDWVRYETAGPEPPLAVVPQ